MSHERYCKHCDQWYPAEDWHEDEDVVQMFSGEAVEIIRTVECPSCRSTHDALAPPLRERAS